MNIIIKKILNLISSVFPMIIFFVYSTHTIHAAFLSLTWNANTEADLAVYRIYYGTSPGSYQASQDTVKVTSHTLTNLNEGTTYYLALAAFDTSSNESQKSTETSGIARGPEQCADGIDNDGDGFAPIAAILSAAISRAMTTVSAPAVTGASIFSARERPSTVMTGTSAPMTAGPEDSRR